VSWIGGLSPEANFQLARLRIQFLLRHRLRPDFELVTAGWNVRNLKLPSRLLIAKWGVRTTTTAALISGWMLQKMNDTPGV